MRTANNTNNYTVEGLVAKYRNFVKENSPKEYVPSEWQDENGKWHIDDFYALTEPDAEEQLLVSLYKDLLGDQADAKVLLSLSKRLKAFKREAFNEDEYIFLCENFSAVSEYLFDHWDEWLGGHTMLSTSSSIVKKYVLDKSKYQVGQTVFITDASSCDVAAMFSGCKVQGFTGYCGSSSLYDEAWALGQIRLFAAGIESEIVPGTQAEDGYYSFPLPPKGTVDLVIYGTMWTTKCADLEALYDLLKDGGRMLIFFSHFRYPLIKQEASFFHKLVNKREISSIISFEDEDLFLGGSETELLIIVEKKQHSTTYIESTIRGISSNVDSVSLDSDILFPGYYLANRPNEGCPLSSLVSLFNSKAEWDKQRASRQKRGLSFDKESYYGLSGDLLVLAAKDLGERYCDANIAAKELSPLSDPMFEDYRIRMLELDNHGVCLRGNSESLKVGYINGNLANYVCLTSTPYLIPKRGIDVRYIAALLLSPEVKQQIISICDGDVTTSTLSRVLNKIIVPKHNPKERIQFLADANYEALVSTQQEMKKNHEDYKKAVRMRKHALTQKLSTFKEKFSKLNSFRERNGGKLNDEDVLSRITGSRVKDAFEFLNIIVEEMMPVIEHIADVEYSFKKPERINIKSFIENYIAQNMSARLNFKPIIAWHEYVSQLFKNTYYNISKRSVYEDNKVLYDFFMSSNDLAKTDKYFSSINTYENGDFDKYFDLLKNSGAYSIWFPEDALTLIINNIVSNAKEHAFTDESRTDYMLRFSLENNGTELSLIIENNGTPIPDDRDVASLLEYGVSSALHQNGHNGIGCNEIDDIMRRYDGRVEIKSTPKDEYTVKYVLSFNSIYDSESDDYFTKYLNSIIRFLQEKNDN